MFGTETRVKRSTIKKRTNNAECTSRRSKRYNSPDSHIRKNIRHTVSVIPRPSEAILTSITVARRSRTTIRSGLMKDIEANVRRKKAGTISAGRLGNHVRTNASMSVNFMVGYQASFRFAALATFLTREPHESLWRKSARLFTVYIVESNQHIETKKGAHKVSIKVHIADIIIFIPIRIRIRTISVIVSFVFDPYACNFHFRLVRKPSMDSFDPAY
ncbi:hypothetical protein CLF_106685 [Clonorchis sinensis]|uniref:Uncharacterized protein n=1 Tax=Clonorchis sinensis TaxID=79923 RepID=G7YFI4_CLOSI|nr:hypothetical protein CLF_106685 [Clonorchis sinensis]